MRASARPRPSAVRTPATTRPVAGSMTSPRAFTATRAATTRPSGSTMAAVPIPAFMARPGAEELAHGGAGSRPHVALGHGTVGGRRRRLVAAVRGGSHLRIADRQVEQDGRGNDGHAHDARLLAQALLLEPLHGARGRGEAEGAAAREHDGLDLLHRVHRIEQVGLPRSRRAPAHVHAGDGSPPRPAPRCTRWVAPSG